MGDYLYSRAIIELVRLDDLEPLRVFARVTNAMTIGEMRQLEAHDKLAYGRSEEHTSELQSRLHLVCRLLLEKKKQNRIADLRKPPPLTGHTPTTARTILID